MIDRLAELVRLESPSRDKPALDTLAALLAGWLRDAGASVEIIPNAHGGDHLVGRFPGTGATSGRLSFWATSIRSGRVGTLERMPFRLDGSGRATGPASST